MKCFSAIELRVERWVSVAVSSLSFGSSACGTTNAVITFKGLAGTRDVTDTTRSTDVNKETTDRVGVAPLVCASGLQKCQGTRAITLSCLK